MRRNDHLEAALREIEIAGGEIDRVEHRSKHLMVFWRLGERKLTYCVPSTSRSVRGTWNIMGDIRRVARQPCLIATMQSNSSI